MKARFSLFVCLLLAFTTVIVLAQDSAVYNDPVGRFNVPIPRDWTNQSTDAMGRFVSPDGLTVFTLAVEAENAEAGIHLALTAIASDLIGAEPTQTYVETIASGTWNENVYAPTSDRFVLLATQWLNGNTYALFIDAPSQDAFQANQIEIASIFADFNIGDQLDLTGVEPQPLTDAKLADLASYIEDAREHFHVSAASIAIVQNGKIVYTGGFGTTEAGGGQPVTSTTLFMIGSINKSMTTMMMSTLVDEGVLSWDQPVTDILPSFVLSDLAATAKIRVRDLVNMSSGVPSYDTILAFAKFTPQEMIASLASIPMVAAPGETWNYNNQMVTTGGYLSALVTGSPADKLYEGYVELVQKHVFDPIGMPSTTFNFDAAIANPNHALPYGYNPVTHRYEAISLDNERFVLPVAPAGAAWSNAEDMGRYLQTELSSGVSPDGARVVSEAALHTTQTAEIAGFYGMGWFTDSYIGLPLIWHGGNTAGFSSDLAFLPTANLGVVILSDAWEAGQFTKSIREYTFELAFDLKHESAERYDAAQETQGQSVSEILTLLPETLADPAAVEPYLGTYDHNLTLEMRGNELWLVGAFAQASLHPAGSVPGMEVSDYVGRVGFNPLRVRFLEADGHVTLELTNLLSGEVLTFAKA